MGLINKVLNHFCSQPISPVYYTEQLVESYNGRSLAGSDLKGKFAIVTGGYGGIGGAISRRLLIEGCTVYVCGRNEEKIRTFIKQLEDKGLSKAMPLVIDNSNHESVRRELDNLLNQVNVDILVNCAGVFTEADRTHRFRSVPIEDYTNVIDINLKSSMLFSYYIIQHMLSKNIRGHVLNISSVNGLIKSETFTPYGISKASLIAFTESLSRKYKDDIIVNGIAPGPVVSDMSHKFLGDNIVRGGSNSLNRYNIPEEIAALVAYLCSKNGCFFNGRTIEASSCHKV